MRRGEVYWAVVVSHDGFNSNGSWRSVVVVPLSTSTSTARAGPTAIGLPASAGGLGKASVALCHQVTTLDRANLTRRIGSLSPQDLDRLSAGLMAALEMG